MLYDVAIVGFGPVGAVAAALLGQAGLRVHVCERLNEVYDIPRALAIDHEVLRVFQQLGIANIVARHFEPFTPSEYYGADGQLIRRMTMVDPPYPQGYTPSVVFTQPPVERALRARVAQLPNVTVALETELRALESCDADSVTLALQPRAAGLEHAELKHVRARWVIACDGGSSTVRGLLGAAVEDLDFDEPWLVVDVRVRPRGLAKLPAVSVQYCEPERPCTFVIGPGNHRRWEISLKPNELSEPLTPERTWRLLSRWLTPEDGELWRHTAYRFHALVAERWRHGRVFLAGDAAHMQPPFLGQGLCQGIRDVANLCWKLTAALDGEVSTDASEALLNSYGLERKAHVRELTSRIKAVGAVICERDLNKARERDARILAECGGVVKDTPRQDVLPALEDGWFAPPTTSTSAALPTARARGTLFPQPRLAADGVGEPRLMDDEFGYGWRLVVDRGLSARVREPGLTVIALGARGLHDTDGILDAWMQRYKCLAALVRPDHYVYGVAATPHELSALLTYWRASLAGSPVEEVWMEA